MTAQVREARAALYPAAPCRGAHGSRPRWCEPQRSLCITSQPLRQGTPTSGFRMFSRRVTERIDIELDQGFCYSIELLVKAHRLAGASASFERVGLNANTAPASFAC